MGTVNATAVYLCTQVDSTNGRVQVAKAMYGEMADQAPRKKKEAFCSARAKTERSCCLGAMLGGFDDALLMTRWWELTVRCCGEGADGATSGVCTTTSRKTPAGSVTPAKDARYVSSRSHFPCLPLSLPSSPSPSPSFPLLS
eukprot:2632895-Rhodomonas_salina.1